MYLKINKFLLSHEYLNMSKIPGFYQFFYSSDVEVSLHGPRNIPNWIAQPSSPLPSDISPINAACCTAGTTAQAMLE